MICLKRTVTVWNVHNDLTSPSVFQTVIHLEYKNKSTVLIMWTVANSVSIQSWQVGPAYSPYIWALLRLSQLFRECNSWMLPYQTQTMKQNSHLCTLRYPFTPGQRQAGRDEVTCQRSEHARPHHNSHPNRWLQATTPALCLLPDDLLGYASRLKIWSEW